jgi:hypothetical protein
VLRENCVVNSMSESTIAYLQGLYFSITGIWPILHMKSFLKITGPKTDLWLVKTVGLLVLTTGLALLMAANEAIVSRPLVFLAVTQSLGLAFIDIHYSLTGRISKIYLADAVCEFSLIAMWLCPAVRVINL